MKYRNHSLRYVPRTGVPKPTRNSNTPRETPEHPEKDAHFSPIKHDEPLFSVDDKNPRFESLKLFIAGLSELIKSVTIPRSKLAAKKAYSWTRPRIIRVTNSSFIKAKNLSKRLPFSNTVIVRIAIVVLLFTAGYLYAHRSSTTPPNAQTPINTGSQNQEPIGGTTPTYNTLLPGEQSIEDLGGWSRVSPPNSNPVFAFVDTLERVEISVSQQPLPDTFSSNPDEDVKELALGFNAKERVVADDATVYFVGTSTKGPQSVILTKKGVLILIKSPIQIKNEVWSRYIAELQ